MLAMESRRQVREILTLLMVHPNPGHGWGRLRSGGRGLQIFYTDPRSPNSSRRTWAPPPPALQARVGREYSAGCTLPGSPWELRVANPTSGQERVPPTVLVHFPASDSASVVAGAPFRTPGYGRRCAAVLAGVRPWVSPQSPPCREHQSWTRGRPRGPPSGDPYPTPWPGNPAGTLATYGCASVFRWRRSYGSCGVFVAKRLARGPITMLRGRRYRTY